MNTRTWMVKNIDLFTDPITGEVNEAGLAELFCQENGRELEKDGTAPDGIYKIADQIARAHEIKTGAREWRMSRQISNFFDHVSSNFDMPKVKGGE